MRISKWMLGVLAMVAGGADAGAEAPRVAASSAPIHSLVARVMEGVGEPGLILPVGATPHHHALRPSEAATLSDAEVVFWIGHTLEPWLEGPLEGLGAGARIIELADVPGLHQLPMREGGAWEEHVHDHAHEGEEPHGEGEHAHEGEEPHGHGEHAHEGEEPHGHGEHAHDGEEPHGHGEHGHGEHGHGEHGGSDPHYWLDPVNAAIWMNAIAEALAEADPDNAEAYRANAEAGQADLEALSAEIAARAEALHGKPYIVFHDAYQYFEKRFGLAGAGSVTIDGESVGAARIAEIQERIEEAGATCIFAEPQFPARVAERIAADTGVRIGALDPLGAGLESGAGFYPALIEGLMDGFEECLSQ